MTSRAVLHGHLLAILGHDLSFDAVLGQAETLPLGIFFHLEGMRSLDEILNRDNASDALDKIERFANKVEITLAVLGHLRLLGKEMHGFAKSGGDGFAVLDMLAKRFAKAQDRVELAAILPVVGSHVHAQKRRVVLLLQGLDAGFRDFQLVHQSDDMLNQLFSRNRMILHLWGGLLEIASSEEQIRSGMDKMQKEIDCAALYFLASDGSCMTQDGEKSSLGSQTGLGTHLSDGEDVVVNAALPGKPQMLVFVCPEAKGTYRGFTYDAIAVAYYNDTVLSAIDSSAFDGAAHSYVIYSDGRVVLDSNADSDDPVYNLLAELRGNSDLSEKKFDALSDDFAQGRNGSMMLTLRGTRYYLVYENIGI